MACTHVPAHTQTNTGKETCTYTHVNTHTHACTHTPLLVANGVSPLPLTPSHSINESLPSRISLACL